MADLRLALSYLEEVQRDIGELTTAEILNRVQMAIEELAGLMPLPTTGGTR